MGFVVEIIDVTGHHGRNVVVMHKASLLYRLENGIAYFIDGAYVIHYLLELQLTVFEVCDDVRASRLGVLDLIFCLISGSPPSPARSSMIVASLSPAVCFRVAMACLFSWLAWYKPLIFLLA